jgi:hypothetical protein
VYCINEQTQATGVVANDANGAVTITGYTKGSLFEDNAGDSDVFAITLDQFTVCNRLDSNAPALFTSLAAGQTFANTINTVAGATLGVSLCTILAMPSMATTGGVTTTGLSAGAATGSSMTFMVVNQLQFMGTTSLIDANQSKQVHT